VVLPAFARRMTLVHQQTCSSGFAAVGPYWDRQRDRQKDRCLPFRRPCSSYYASSAKLPIISSARFVIVLICQFVDPLALSSNRIGQSRCDSQPVRRYVQNSRRQGLVFMLRRLRSNHSFCQSFVSRVSHQPRNRPSLFLELPPSTVADSMRPF